MTQLANNLTILNMNIDNSNIIDIEKEIDIYAIIDNLNNNSISFNFKKELNILNGINLSDINLDLDVEFSKICNYFIDSNKKDYNLNYLYYDFILKKQLNKDTKGIIILINNVIKNFCKYKFNEYFINNKFSLQTYLLNYNNVLKNIRSLNLKLSIINKYIVFKKYTILSFLMYYNLYDIFLNSKYNEKSVISIITEELNNKTQSPQIYSDLIKLIDFYNSFFNNFNTEYLKKYNWNKIIFNISNENTIENYVNIINEKILFILNNSKVSDTQFIIKEVDNIQQLIIFSLNFDPNIFLKYYEEKLSERLIKHKNKPEIEEEFLNYYFQNKNKFVNNNYFNLILNKINDSKKSEAFKYKTVSIYRENLWFKNSIIMPNVNFNAKLKYEYENISNTYKSENVFKKISILSEKTFVTIKYNNHNIKMNLLQFKLLNLALSSLYLDKLYESLVGIELKESQNSNITLENIALNTLIASKILLYDSTFKLNNSLKFDSESISIIELYEKFKTNSESQSISYNDLYNKILYFINENNSQIEYDLLNSKLIEFYNNKLFNEDITSVLNDMEKNNIITNTNNLIALNNILENLDEFNFEDINEKKLEKKSENKHILNFLGF